MHFGLLLVAVSPALQIPESGFPEAISYRILTRAKGNCQKRSQYRQVQFSESQL